MDIKQEETENKLSQVIKNSGKPLKVISEETQIGYQTLANYKNGRRTPKNDTMQKLADYFNVSIGYLMGHENVSISTIDEWLDKRVEKETLEFIEEAKETYPEDFENIKKSYEQGELDDSNVRARLLLERYSLTGEWDTFTKWKEVKAKKLKEDQAGDWNERKEWDSLHSDQVTLIVERYHNHISPKGMGRLLDFCQRLMRMGINFSPEPTSFELELFEIDSLINHFASMVVIHEKYGFDDMIRERSEKLLSEAFKIDPKEFAKYKKQSKEECLKIQEETKYSIN